MDTLPLQLLFSILVVVKRQAFQTELKLCLSCQQLFHRGVLNSHVSDWVELWHRAFEPVSTGGL